MLTEVILEEIQDGIYSCIICSGDIGPKSRVWSCDTCYRVYDLPCIKDWSSRSDGRTWRCPQCSKTHKSQGLKYRCWCGKHTAPDPIPNLPHSCGQTCGARLSCPHPCASLCHPGPHKTCTALGPRIKCFCGRVANPQMPCASTRYGGFSCENKCGKKLSCGEHTCRRPCHKGSCGPCKIKKKIPCYCGKTKKGVNCSRACKGKDGAFSCDKQCASDLDCGHHKCEKLCHPSSISAHECPLMPRPGERCPCSNRLVVELRSGIPRTSCLDPIPTCTSICSKPLACGHPCTLTCHSGPCGPCAVVTTMPCACGSQRTEVKCGSELPTCHSKCGAQLICGRHKCQRECCEFAAIAKQRQRKQKRTTIQDIDQMFSSMGLSEDESAAHMCTESCGRLLSCRKHVCKKICHPGNCGRCLEFSSDDWECPCGRTQLLAPIRCGTATPDCKFKCHRQQSCEHPANHRCHDDSEKCPPCTISTLRPCKCGKNNVRLPCNSDRDARCTFECGKVLPCGHGCAIICHDGECPPCSGDCLRAFSCGHRHKTPCHGLRECGECKETMIARCRCGNLALPFECGEDLEIFCNETCINTEPPYDPILLSLYENNKAFCQEVERQVREFVQSPAKTLWFKPMKKSKRRFVHYLIEHYGITGVSLDRGPNRAVCASKTPSSWYPKVTLGRAITLQRIHGIAPTIGVGLDEVDDGFESD